MVYLFAFGKVVVSERNGTIDFNWIKRIPFEKMNIESIKIEDNARSISRVIPVSGSHSSSANCLSSIKSSNASLSNFLAGPILILLKILILSFYNKSISILYPIDYH